MLTKCPTCGGKLQMTVTIDRWYTLTSDGWQHYDDSEPGESGPIKAYCENDHDIDAALVPSPPS